MGLGEPERRRRFDLRHQPIAQRGGLVGARGPRGLADEGFHAVELRHGIRVTGRLCGGPRRGRSVQPPGEDQGDHHQPGLQSGIGLHLGAQ
jgi:hypothetical protein